MSLAWMRVLNVVLTSKKSASGKAKRLQFGTNWTENRDDLSIEVNCNKYMSGLKDEAIVRISNLTYFELTSIINNQYYDIEIQCGYRKGNVQTIFKGAIFYVSNDLNDTKTNTVILICTSYAVAAYGQKRINLGLTSGINVYTQIKKVLGASGIKDAAISAQLKKTMLEHAESISKSSTEWLEDLINDSGNIIVNTDLGVSGSTISVFDANRSNMRLIKLNNDLINLAGGYPRLTNEGLTMTVMPTFAFMCGDVVNIDNSIINISVSGRSDVSKNYGYYLDKDGNYMIMSMQYILENRGSQFGLNLQCKSRSLISNFSGEL